LGGDNFSFDSNPRGVPYIDLTTGDDSLRLGRYSLEELLTVWAKEAQEFKEKAKQYYLYK
jgi:uncharacterized protein YbbC (DUF1343 family)